MKKLLLILTFSLCYLYCISGTHEWVREIYYSQRIQGVSSIATDANKNVFMTGYFIPCQSCAARGYVEILDSSGNGINQLILFCPGNSGGCNVKSISTDTLGYYYISGSTYGSNSISLGSDSITSPSTNWAFLAKLDLAGNLIWKKVFSDSPIPAFVSDVAGNIYLSNDTVTTKYNKNGTLVWINPLIGGSKLIVNKTDLYVANSQVIHKLQKGNGALISDLLFPNAAKIYSNSTNILYILDSSGVHKYQSMVFSWSQNIANAVGVTRDANGNVWVLQKGLSLIKLNNSTGAIVEQNHFNAGLKCNELTSDGSGNLLYAASYDIPRFNYVALRPFTFQSYYNEHILLAKYHPKNDLRNFGFNIPIDDYINSWMGNWRGEYPACSGQPLSLSICGGGIFNSGNNFTAELSDSTGNFSNPTIIGSTYSTTPNTGILANIPISINHGSGYFIRITSSNPAIIGQTNQFPLGFFTTESNLTLTGGTTFCKGSGTINVLTNGSANYYIWSRNGNPYPAGNGLSTIKPSQSGTYEVEVRNDYGCYFPSTNNITVSVLPLPEATINSSGTINLCAGQTTLLSVVNPNAGYNYNWVRNNINTGVTSNQYTASAAGTYKFIATANNGCTKNSQPIAVQIYNSSAIVQGSPSFCIGDSVALIANANAVNYQWKKNNVIIPSATNQTYYASSAGNYKVFTTNAAGCSSNSSSIAISTPCRQSMNGSVPDEFSLNIQNDKLHISFTNPDQFSRIDVFNSLGQTLYSTHIDDKNLNISLNYSPLKSTICFVRLIKKSGEAQSIKVIDVD